MSALVANGGLFLFALFLGVVIGWCLCAVNRDEKRVRVPRYPAGLALALAFLGLASSCVDPAELERVSSSAHELAQAQSAQSSANDAYRAQSAAVEAARQAGELNQAQADQEQRRLAQERELAIANAVEQAARAGQELAASVERMAQDPLAGARGINVDQTLASGVITGVLGIALNAWRNRTRKVALAKGGAK